MSRKNSYKSNAKEKNRIMKLKKLENELRETKAEESQQEKSKIFTEISNLLFTLYFRILKKPSNSTVLSLCLEGLSK